MIKDISRYNPRDWAGNFVECWGMWVWHLYLSWRSTLLWVCKSKRFCFYCRWGTDGFSIWLDSAKPVRCVVTDGGYILVCNDDARASKVFRCVTLLNGQGYLRGIAVDPNEGYSYRNNALVTRNLASMILKFRHYALALYTTQGTPSRRMWAAF